MAEQQPEVDRSNLVGKGEWTREAVPPGCECPGCKEWCPDLLVWIEDDRVECQTCGAIYDPRDGKVYAYHNSDGGIEDAGGA
jgi:Zn ribbon nucleic-acid-binding protein